ncbi:caffeic acid 3-O-methyltransferase [Trifolium pratense]|uniref:Caffeic acid 3-O-methyltransferase n=1 Tax=Trifolium pratense TaxID=57577 RepID=A0A2K3KGN2_TRIPR|nr:caffeic acid 3-O-methyltransferase [Trifolium pratense]
MDKEGNIVFYNSESWQNRKRKLEEETEFTNAEIERYKEREDEVAKKKTELFNKGRMLKADWDDMMIHAPEVKAEQELANQTQDNIEAEWFNLRQQFIRRTSFKDWM